MAIVRPGLFSGLCLLILGLFSPSSAALPDSEHEILIKMRPQLRQLQKASARASASSGSEQVDRIIHRRGAARLKRLREKGTILNKSAEPLFRWLTVTLPAAADRDSVIEELRQSPEVEYVQENRAFRLDYLPDDPLIADQYALEKIKAFAAWDVERGDASIPIAVIDTGIDYHHPDLVNAIWINPGEDLNHNHQADAADMNGIDDDGNGFVDDVMGWDFTDAPNYPDGGDYLGRDADPWDEHGHGTAVAGLIAATANNGIGIAGLAHGCRIMVLRSFTSTGYGEEDDAASAILYAIDNGARVINMSWGDVFISRLLDDVIQYAASQNVVLVASCGNSATDQIHYPSGFAQVISVGATDQNDHLASFSNFGPSIDLVAPGVSILSTIRDAQYDSSLNGTSFSAPYVSAAAALVLSQDPQLTADQVRGILAATADDLGDPGPDDHYGNGRLNVARALTHRLGAMVSIAEPWLDQGFSAGPVSIVGSAWTPTMDEYRLSYGIGDRPEEWHEFAAVSQRRILNDVLGTWENLPKQDTTCTIRLQTLNRGKIENETSVRIFMDQTAPAILRSELTPMWDGDHAAVLVSLSTDDICNGSLLYRPLGSSAPWEVAEMGYRSDRPEWLISSQMISQKIQIEAHLTNTAGLSTALGADGLWTMDLSQPPLDRVRYSPENHLLPQGQLLIRPVDFNGNHIPEIVIGWYDAQNQLNTSLFEFDGAEYRQIASLPRGVIPRDAGDTDGDGRPELLAGYGAVTYLYQASACSPLTFTEAKVWQDTQDQYWGARLADIDGDGSDEVIMRVVTPDQENYQIFKYQGPGSYRLLAQIANPTAGENFNGVPHCEVGDFDGDGRMEILLGDSDGDLYISEFNGSTFQPVWQERLPLTESMEYLSSGDYDGDGVLEFAAGCHSNANLNTEHYFDSRHWCYRIYDRIADNRFQSQAEWRFYGFESPKDFDSGVSSGDIDGDGRAELLICVFPDFYVAEMDESGAYRLSFHAAPVQISGAAVLDADQDGRNEFWIGDGEAIRPYTLNGVLSGPAVPAGLRAQPLDEGHVYLQWYPVPGAQSYRVYRAAGEAEFQLLEAVAENSYNDESVVSGQLYRYAVTACDPGKNPSESIQSAVVSARPGARPCLVAAEMAASQAVMLHFSEPMGAGADNPVNYALERYAGQITSCAVHASGREILLHLSRPIVAAGDYRITATHIQDQDGTPLDTTRCSAQFRADFPAAAPYLVSCALVGDAAVDIHFNEPMDVVSLTAPENYDFGDGIKITTATPLQPAHDGSRVAFSASTPLGASGRVYTLRVRNVKNEAGVAIRSGYGDALQLMFAATDLKNLYTYPNPYRAGLDKDGIMFAGLPSTAEVQIFTFNGYPIRTLTETDGNGGVLWDVRDEKGALVASGIYLYRITSGGRSRIDKLAIVR